MVPARCSISVEGSLDLQLCVFSDVLTVCVLVPFFSIQCPDSACKQDLLAYLQRIALYCHQLNICSKVKAEVQNLGGELIVSGVSSSRRPRDRLSGTNHET